MKKNELIKKINEFNEKLSEILFDSIIEIIENETKLIQCTDEESISGSNGFYMIFCDQKLTQEAYSIELNNKMYYCVYRGHSYTMGSRLKSHFYYNPNDKYENCMKVSINGHKCNINLKEKKFYEYKKKIDLQFPNWEWAYSCIPLTNSKQALREMFEYAFDKRYTKPIYSLN